MATSTLDPDNIPEPDRQLAKGHSSKALGPSDISDTGSDVQGGFRAVEEDMLGLDTGTNEDPDTHNLPPSPGTTDSTGTGESSTAGRNADVDLNADIEADRIESITPSEESEDMEDREDTGDTNSQRRQS